MDIKSYCPYCGVYTTVQITQEESVSYYRRKKLPTDFSERAVCPCCVDDRSPFATGVSNHLYDNLVRT
jgi:hypothetical protein